MLTQVLPLLSNQIVKKKKKVPDKININLSLHTYQLFYIRLIKMYFKLCKYFTIKLILLSMNLLNQIQAYSLVNIHISYFQCD